MELVLFHKDSKFAVDMKKPILYLFLFGILFIKFSSIFSMELNEISYFEKKQVVDYFKCYNNQNLSLNFYFIIDSDTENNESSSQFFSTNKNTFPHTCLSSNGILPIKNILFRNSNLKKYFLENLFKIKRYTFLSLRVLRI